MKTYDNMRRILLRLEDEGYSDEAHFKIIRAAIINALKTYCSKTIDSYFNGMVESGILLHHAGGVWKIKNPFKERPPEPPKEKTKGVKK